MSEGGEKRIVIEANCKIRRKMQDAYWALLDGKRDKKMLASVILHLLDDWLREHPNGPCCCEACDWDDEE